MLVEWMRQFVSTTADALGTEMFLVKGVIAVVLVCLLCGMVGSLVVGNRMAFFSDAMAHCAFAGVALGFLTLVLTGRSRDDAAESWIVPLIMILFGSAVGVAIAYVRDKTTLATDTVIGVFFAFAIGFGTMLFTVLKQVSTFNPEQFLFGTPLFVPMVDLVYLALLFLLACVFFAWRYNAVVFASFNPSLARTRRVSLALNNYLFVILLALVVNLSIKSVGALLINALLVVPAATALNHARNIRQMFWLTILLCVTSGLAGLLLSYYVRIPLGHGVQVPFGPSGAIVVFSVALFFASFSWRLISGRKAVALTAR